MGVVSCSKKRDEGRKGCGSWRRWRVGAGPGEEGNVGVVGDWGWRGLQVLDLLYFLVDEGLRVGLFPPGWIGCEVSFWDGLEAWCCVCWCC